MSEPREINPVLRQALELGPPLIFFGLYLWLRDQAYVVAGTEYDGFIVAAAIFIPIMLAAMGLLWWLTGTLSRLQLFTAVMVIFFGGLTVWFNDERFIKIKTTIVYGFFAGMLAIGLLQRRSYLEWIMTGMIPMTHDGWMIFTKRMCGIFAALAVANEIIWRTLSTDLWVKIETFGFPIALFAFLMAQAPLFQRYEVTEDS